MARSLFAVVRDMCDDGGDAPAEVTKNDLFHYLVTNSEVSNTPLLCALAVLHWVRA